MGKSSRSRRSRSRSRGRYRSRSRSGSRRYHSERSRRHYSSDSDSDHHRHHTSSGHRRRDRRRSRSRSESRSRSHERSRKTRRRRRRSSSYSRSRSRSRSSDRAASSARKTRSDRDSPRQRDSSGSRGEGRSGERNGGGTQRAGKEKATSRDFSKDIPGYSAMSPAERVKAKLKLMLERSTSGLVKQTQATPTAPPTDSQLASIEGEGFAAESFISHRTAGKQAIPSSTASNLLPSSTLLSREVDPSEYQPQVVILDERLSEGGVEEKEEGTGILISQQAPEQTHSQPSSPAPQTPPLPSPAPSHASPSPAMDKSQRWLLKLQRMRQKFPVPPTD